jgi:hypothetical protein
VYRTYESGKYTSWSVTFERDGAWYEIVLSFPGLHDEHAQIPATGEHAAH